MIGSDWPICLLALEYRAWFDIVNSVVKEFPKDQQDDVWSKTAQRVYKLKPQKEFVEANWFDLWGKDLI